MEDPLVLGITDGDEKDAPRRRFATTDMRSTSRSIFLLPIFSLSFVSILSQLFGKSEEPERQGGEQHRAEPQLKPEDDLVTSTVPPSGSPRRHTHSIPHDEADASGPAPSGGGRLNPVSSTSTFEAGTVSRASFIAANDNLHRTVYSPLVGFAPLKPFSLVEPHATNSGGEGGTSSSLQTTPSSQGSGSSQQDPTGATTAPEPSMPPARQLNRRPMVFGPVVMSDGLVNEAIIISMAELLVGATDADGDELSVQALTVDAGELKAIGFNMWLYTPATDQVGEVTFHYDVSDGQDSVIQSAVLNLVKPTGEDVVGTDGDDVLIGTPFADFIDARAGDDIVYGRESNDIIYGGDGNDRLIGGDGDDVIYGGNGNDILFGGNGNDTLFGGDGNDILYGDAGKDLLFGGNGDDILHGGDGDDQLSGEAGNDLLSGDAGNDLLYGAAGDDTLDGGDGDDLLFGGDGEDTINGGNGNDLLFGEAGNDILQGNAGDDTINGGDGDDQLFGGDGNDVLDGGSGHNEIDAGNGDDIIHISDFSSSNTIDGGAGADLLDLSDATRDTTVDLEEGRAEVGGIECAKIIEIENIRGGSGNDSLVANEQVNIMIGGAGNDVFVFRNLDALTNDGSQSDRISDFSVGDRIDFSRLGETIENFADQKLFFSGLASATPSEIGELRYEHSFLPDQEEVTVITGHLGDDDDHDFGLILDGYHDLTANDFILAAKELESHSA